MTLMPEPLLRVVQASEPDAVRLAMHRMSKEMREILMGVTSQLNIPDGDAFWVILAAMAEMMCAAHKTLDKKVVEALSPKSKENLALQQSMLQAAAAAGNLLKAWQHAKAEGLSLAPGALDPLRAEAAAMAARLGAVETALGGLTARFDAPAPPPPGFWEKARQATPGALLTAVFVVALHLVFRRLGWF